MTQPEDFDILIIGAGLAGTSLACALRGSRFRVGVLEVTPAPGVAAGWDARIYAISPANVAFLSRIGAWSLLDRQRVQAVSRMDVRGDRGGRLQFSAYDAGLPALAQIAESSRLAAALRAASQQAAGVCFVQGQASALSRDETGASVRLADGRVLRAALVVGADGAHSWTRQAAGLQARARPYGELGVVANFQCERPHRGTAFQWFRADGILAYLPLPANQISIVWSTPEPHARTLLGLSDEALAEQVAEAGEQVLGRLQVMTPAQGFPLRQLQASAVVAPRLALIGDAAHGVHPLSGHGINLGFQDAAALSEVLQALPAAQDLGDLHSLRRYARLRAEETWMIQRFTHGLHELFRPGLAPLAWLRNAGLDVAGKIPGLRSMAIRYAAGLW
jgi:ubiquinone biosynthesis UbiH/UbiF/VisC/COQ6 family hydroxylase